MSFCRSLHVSFVLDTMYLLRLHRTFIVILSPCHNYYRHSVPESEKVYMIALIMKSTEVLNPRRGVPQWSYDVDTQTCTCQRICGSHGHYPHLHTHERCIIIPNTITIGTAPTSCSMFAYTEFQRLSCGFYVLYPSLACSKFAQVFQRLLHSHCTVLHCQAALYV